MQTRAARRLWARDVVTKMPLSQSVHQGRENIASHPLKLFAISIIFCGNFQ
jgi:hypothetical protein